MHHGLEIEAAATEAERRDLRRTLGTSLEPFGEHPFLNLGAVKTKSRHFFNELMWWAHKDLNLGPAD